MITKTAGICRDNASKFVIFSDLLYPVLHQYRA